MPGLRLGLVDLDAEALVCRYRSRAAQHAISARIQASTTHYRADQNALMARSAHVQFYHSRSSRYTTLAVPTQGGTIVLYECSKRLVKRHEELHVHHEARNAGPTHILKMAFAEETKDLAVLCTQDDDRDEKPVRRPFRLDRYTHPITTYKLILFPRCHAAVKGYYYDSSQQESRDIIFQKGAKVTGLALAKNGTACIVWNDARARKSSLVWLVYRNKDLMGSQQFDTSPALAPALASTSDFHGKVVRCNVGQVGTILEMSAYGDTFPSWYNVISDNADHQSSDVTSYSVALNFDEDLMDGNMKRRPSFHVRHAGTQTWRNHDSSDGSVCRWVELFLVEVVHKDPPQAHPSMFIACSEEFKDSNRCDHTNSSAAATLYYGAQNKPLALLGGYRRSNSNLGTVLAISPNATRIAAAVWDHIYLWTFSPKLLTEGDLSLYFPTQDYNSKGGFGRLRPSLISSSHGIVHSMYWTNEEIFYAVTDQGISKYDLSPELLGFEEYPSLTWDVWSTTARTEAAPGTREDGLPATLTEYTTNYD